MKKEKMLYYTGIGARETPKEILSIFNVGIYKDVEEIKKEINKFLKWRIDR